MKITESIRSKLQLKWSDSNSKLAKDNIVSFNLPAYKTQNDIPVCHGATTACSTFCYARQGHFIFDRAQNLYHHNFNIAYFTPDIFRKYLREDLSLLKHSIVRIHSSGDFFNRKYLQTWIDAAYAFPKKMFYCYSKIVHMIIRNRDIDIPNNFIYVQSLKGKFDEFVDWNMPVAKVFKCEEDIARENILRLAMGESKFWVNCSDSDIGIVKQVKLVALVYHGNRGRKLV